MIDKPYTAQLPFYCRMEIVIIAQVQISWKCQFFKYVQMLIKYKHYEDFVCLINISVYSVRHSRNNLGTLSFYLIYLYQPAQCLTN